MVPPVAPRAMLVLPSQRCCCCGCSCCCCEATDVSHEPLHVKKPTSLEAFAQAASLHLRLICPRPCLWLCVVAADKVRTDVFGVIFTPPTSMILSSLPPVSSSSNLGLIVFVIKHSCTDPSVNPLTPADYMGVGWGGSPPTQTGPAALRPPHGSVLLAP